MIHPDHLQHLPEDPHNGFLFIPAAVRQRHAEFRDQFRIRIRKAAAHQIVERISENRHDIQISQKRTAALSLFKVPNIYSGEPGQLRQLELGKPPGKAHIRNSVPENAAVQFRFIHLVLSTIYVRDSVTRSCIPRQPQSEYYYRK